jgi:hypothetical protein
MIVKPDFFDHWKTQLLIQTTKDKSSPLAVLRGWAYCHLSRRWQFPEMTAAQLAAVCRWGKRKPACDVALLEAGFVERCESGFSFHDWEQENAQLVQKWRCGQKGGRPPKKTDREPDETGRFQPQTGNEPIRQDQTGLEKQHAPSVNLVNVTSAPPDLTSLTASKTSMKRIARDIAADKKVWSWDNCKVKPADLSAASLKTVLESYPDRLTEKEIHDCWREAVTLAHAAAVDQLATRNPAGYAVACFKEQLSNAVKSK